MIRAGDRITNVPHCFWNAGETTARYVQEFRPAGRIDAFFETFFALARDGKLNDAGVPNLLLGAGIMLKHKDDIRVTRPPWPLQYLT